MNLNSKEVVAVLSALIKEPMTSNQLAPKVHCEYRQVESDVVKVRLRSLTDTLLVHMVAALWIRPITVLGRTQYELTASGRTEHHKRTAN